MVYTQVNYKEAIGAYDPTVKSPCNVYAHSVLTDSRLQAAWPKSDNSPYTCLQMQSYIPKGSKWVSVDYKTAQNNANAGWPTIALFADSENQGTNKNDHVAIIYPTPGTISSVKELKVAQSGTKQDNTGLYTISSVFLSSQINNTTGKFGLFSYYPAL